MAVTIALGQEQVELADNWLLSNTNSTVFG